MLKIETRIDAREINGNEVNGLPADKDQLIVKAHWNINRFVVLEWHGNSITVAADDLERAIQNAKNHGH